MIDLEAIKARAEAASRGPWRTDHRLSFDEPHEIHKLTFNDWSGETWDRWEKNGLFIEAAREDVPALVAEVERLRGELDRERRYNDIYEHRIERLAAVCRMAIEMLDDDAPGAGLTERQLLAELRAVVDSVQ